MPVGHDLQKATNEVEVALTRIFEGHLVMLVDTPGFDDIYMADTEVFAKVSAFLTQM
jgi:hypothetical protein